MSKYIEQVDNLQLLVVRSPRYFLKWENTEKGRDKIDCYERLSDGNLIIYINNYNRNNLITKGNPFFDELEEMYNTALKENLEK